MSQARQVSVSNVNTGGSDLLGLMVKLPPESLSSDAVCLSSYPDCHDGDPALIYQTVFLGVPYK